MIPGSPILSTFRPQKWWEDRGDARWISESNSGTKPRKRGRRRKPVEIRQLIIEMAKATGWGYRRILGELKKLRIRNISRATIARILIENGFVPVEGSVLRF